MVPAIKRQKLHFLQTIGQQLFATILLRKLKVTRADTKNVTIGRGCADAWRAGNLKTRQQLLTPYHRMASLSLRRASVR